MKVPLDRLQPAVVNDEIYRPIDEDDPATVQLVESIRRTGVVDPFNITLDDVIVSGHRRKVACQILGITEVLVKVLPIRSTDPAFTVFLVAFNAQRVKSIAEQVREEVVRTCRDDDCEAYEALGYQLQYEQWRIAQRVEDAGLRHLYMVAPAAAPRARITEAKRPMLDAAIEVIELYEDYWPLTLRQIHYRLLTRYILRNALKPETYRAKRNGKTVLVNNRYVNSEGSYKDLSDLLTRARLEGCVPWESMHDPTRPRTTWNVYPSVAPFLREQLDGFMEGYFRDLLQSQDAYVELVVEKITVHEIADRAARPYRVPVGVGRGYGSATTLGETAQRFHASGKSRFVLLIAGDLDPEGEDICRVWAACLEREHGVKKVIAVKAGVNPDQVKEYGLTPLPVKESSSRAAKFIEAHGKNVYELEAFEPDVLRQIIRDTIRDVLDLDRFQAELKKEAEERRYLTAVGKKVRELMKDCRPD